MSRRTNIEQLMDLSEIFDDKGGNNHHNPQHYKGGSSVMEGFQPSNMNPSYSAQMEREISDRDKTRSSFQGKIRQSVDYRTAMNAGVPDNSNFYPMTKPKFVEEEIIDTYKIVSDEDYEMGPKAKRNMRNRDFDDFEDHPHSHHHPGGNCISIARHIKMCPICSKLYDNDKSIYIIGIVFLLVICIILLKKIIEGGDK